MFPLVLILLSIAVAASIYFKKLTVPAAITGGSIAFLLYMGLGWIGIVLLGAFFLLGNLATSLHSHQKQLKGLTENKSGKRNTSQVLANGGVAGVLGLLAWCFPEDVSLFRLMVAGSLASATSDTLSSELGNVYGTRYYNILSFKKDIQGENGVISLEGSAAGIVGSAFIALLYMIISPSYELFLIIVIAGSVGNIVDSLLGAAFERKGYIGNDMVNFLNTVAGAFTIYFLS